MGALVISQAHLVAQEFDITTFDPTSKGDWSNIARTVLVVPKVANGSIKLDGAITSAEYGGFKEVTVTPGINAWILDFPEDRIWDNAADSSFTFSLAHDDDYLYVGVKTKDDIINSDNPNGSFWNDDAIEIVVDALADRLDNNTDNSKDRFGGHCYVNYQGRFSSWDEGNNQIGNQTWSTAVDWKYGAAGDVFGSGGAVAGGWQMEVRFKKRLFEDPDAGNRLRDGYRMGFNIGLDDDDKKGTGANGDKTRSFDLELQYFWANRERREGLTQEFLDGLTDEEKATKAYLVDLPLVINSTGRLSHGGTGEIIFAYDNPASGKILFVTSDSNGLPNADSQFIALLQARGYTVTVFQSTGSAPDDLRNAAAGQDLVFISETIGSTSVVDPAGAATGIFSLKNTDVPVISFEAYMFDNADWVKRTADGSNDFVNWGNTGRSEVDAIGLGESTDSLYIRKPGHPIASGFAAGKLQVYNGYHSLTFGVPSADADVIASADADGKVPVLFVYDKGDKLADGSVAPNRRIGLFLGQAANPTANYALPYAFLNDAGRKLLLNTVEYAIGKAAVADPTISIARSGSNVVVTYAGGTLQSTDKLGGAWSTAPETSPATYSAGGTARFFRVVRN